MPIHPKVYKDQDDAVSCDECGQLTEVPGLADMARDDGILAAIELIRLFGWRGRRDPDRWKFLCPDCVDEGKSR